MIYYIKFLGEINKAVLRICLFPSEMGDSKETEERWEQARTALNKLTASLHAETGSEMHFRDRKK